MPKNNSLQISIFIDKYVKFKISNENYSIDYKGEEITFSELESIIESNLKYWEEKRFRNVYRNTRYLEYMARKGKKS